MIGENEYAEFKITRLQNKTGELFNTIKNIKWANPETKPLKKSKI